MAGGWGKAEITVNDYAAYGERLRELIATGRGFIQMTVEDFRTRFGDSVTIGGDDVHDLDIVTFRRPEDDGSVLTISLPSEDDINEMIAAEAAAPIEDKAGKQAYLLPDFYSEIFENPVYIDLSDPAARERVRNCRLAEYTTNKCH